MTEKDNGMAQGLLTEREWAAHRGAHDEKGEHQGERSDKLQTFPDGQEVSTERKVCLSTAIFLIKILFVSILLQYF